LCYMDILLLIVGLKMVISVNCLCYLYICWVGWFLLMVCSLVSLCARALQVLNLYLLWSFVLLENWFVCLFCC
jgi:hypothetical protein